MKVFPGSVWYDQPGRDRDIVLSSRVTLSRNLHDHPFTAKLDKHQWEKCLRRIEHALVRTGGYLRWEVPETEALNRSVLYESNYIDKEFLNNRRARLYLSQRRNDVIVHTGNNDHLKLICLKAGFSLRSCWESLRSLDSRLDEKLNWAATVNRGYLSPDINNWGTAMRVSVLVHLPFLQQAGFMDQVMDDLHNMGFFIKAYQVNNKVLGSLYQLSNGLTLGLSENQLIGRLEQLTEYLVTYERKAREEALAKYRSEFSGRWGMLLDSFKESDSISGTDAVEGLCALRSGAVAGVVNVDPNLITSLIFRTQPGHLKTYFQCIGRDSGGRSLGQYRSALIKKSLCNLKSEEGVCSKD